MLFLKNRNLAKHEQHPFHLVSRSLWPWALSWSLGSFVLHLVYWFYVSTTMRYFLPLEAGFVLLVLLRWLSDIVKESYCEGHHTRKVKSGLYLGMVLFIVSETMFFFSFFWAYFHCALSPAVMVGFRWPLKGIAPISLLIPTANTVALLASAVAVTYAHKQIVHPHYPKEVAAYRGQLSSAFWALTLAIIYALIFTYVQLWEYKTLTFSIDDGIYGSLFFLLTGFHGLHVIVGTIFLFIVAVRARRFSFSLQGHVGLDCAVWYWHFVDVVWLFLWAILYCDAFPPTIPKFPGFPGCPCEF